MLPGKAVRERTQKTSRDEQRERTRQRVYEAAKALFREKGYLQTRSADIADRAGVSQGAVHAHFASKADILTALMIDYLEQVDRELRALELKGPTTLERLKEAVHHLVAIHTANMEQVNWYYGYAWVWADEEERTYRRLMESIRSRLAEIVADGIARGELREDLPVEMTLDLLQGYYRNHLRRLRFASNQTGNFAQRLDQCVELLFGQYKL